MREIKFRAFVVKNMIEGKEAAMYPIVQYEWGIERHFDKVTLLTPDLTLYTIDVKWCDAIVQYTGLKDKNGTECYWDDWVDDGINPKFLVTPDYHLLARLSEIDFEIAGNKYEG